MPRVLIKGGWSTCQTEEIIDDYYIPDEEWEKMSDDDKEKEAWDAVMDYLSISAWMEVVEDGE